jgi:hypothetical protein
MATLCTFKSNYKLNGLWLKFVTNQQRQQLSIDLYMTKMCHIFHFSFGTIYGRLTYLWPHIKLVYIQAKLEWANIKWP